MALISLAKLLEEAHAGTAPDLHGHAPATLEQRLEIGQRAFTAFRLGSASTFGASDGPVWALDTEHPEVLVGIWPIQTERYSPNPPSFDEDTLSFELWFVGDTTVLDRLDAWTETSSTPPGHWPDTFLAGEQRRAIEREGQALRALIDTPSDANATNTPTVGGTVRPDRSRPRL